MAFREGCKSRSPVLTALAPLVNESVLEIRVQFALWTLVKNPRAESRIVTSLLVKIYVVKSLLVELETVKNLPRKSSNIIKNLLRRAFSSGTKPSSVYLLGK